MRASLLALAKSIYHLIIKISEKSLARRFDVVTGSLSSDKVKIKTDLIYTV